MENAENEDVVMRCIGVLVASNFLGSLLVFTVSLIHYVALSPSDLLVLSIQQLDGPLLVFIHVRL